MTDPSEFSETGETGRYEAQQAYSQAIPLPSPPRGPHAPEPVAGTTPTTPPPKSTRNLLVALLLVAALVALIGAIVYAALNSDSKSQDAGASSSASPVNAFRVNDCLYDVPEAPKVGNCDDGGSPYQVTQVMPEGQTCRPEQTSIADGRWYCLTPNLNVNYCYTTPVAGTWIKAAARCGTPGTISVVSVVPGFKDASRCQGESDTVYTFDSPVYTICAKSFT